MARKTAAEQRAAKAAEATVPRRMPIDYRWETLGGPIEAEIKAAKVAGREALSFEGWRIKIPNSIMLGLMNNTMRALARTDEIEQVIGDSEPTSAQIVEFTDGYAMLLNFLKAHVVDWDFVDAEGEPIPYSEEAWDRMPGQLVMVSFRTIQTSVNNPPKASGSGLTS